MEYNEIEVRPVSGNLGAEIHGVDLREPLSDSVFEEVHQALLEYLVIFFRDQDITPDQQKDFGRRFGELHIHPYIPNLEGHPEIIALRSKETGPAEMSYQSNQWHTDLTYIQEPPMAAILFGEHVPPAGGDTMFLNLYKSYEMLSPKMQAFVEDLTAVHDITASMPADFMEQPSAPKQLENLHKKTPPVEHPIVCTHPETGRKYLYVNRNFTSYIKDLSRTESDTLLEFLYVHLAQPEFVCRFNWETHSVAFWDNRCTQHFAVNDYYSLRVMHRVTVCGEHPV
ncbi:MAG: TauD/TfdA family dioxygenase [Gammaproteobacteria bacterium]|jgi:taurine dioxygenase|nr:TauD/TfdA family dioxygenase [Gammaproteobacteria bacterium]MDP6617104.1 TauD/TfdA family dioxygenase [Gammaproteobacteria bacterium]MDP6695786.1 TauD/TfdA family dioxygenase [Gammaproteobacteria bacterium]